MKKIAMISFLVLMMAFVIAADSSVQTVPQSDHVVPGQFIVVLNDDVANPADVAQELSARHGLIVGHTYSVALKGFSAHIPAQRLWAVESDPRVRFIEPDGIVYAIKGSGRGKGGGGKKEDPPPQETPTGIDRIDAERSVPAEIDVDIAIIDSGVSKRHPDLNFYMGVNFTSTWRRNPDGDDDSGHGSHVAGIAAAIDNDFGVVGVAPGARLWSVKVLNKRGTGSWSDVIKGIDWVTERADEIDVVNMSIGGKYKLDALRDALEKSVAKGIFYAVAAGNAKKDVYGDDGIFETYDDFIPAAYPEVATVSGMIDYDGIPGGKGDKYGDEYPEWGDDCFYPWSNFSAAAGYEWSPPDYPVDSPGGAIDLAAPGVDIKSTWKGTGYNTISGTSMAAPHVAGAAALYISVNGKPQGAAGVATVRQALIDCGAPQDGPKGFDRDPDGNPERLVDAENL